MKFFTPQLYVEFNSDDPTIADRADREWESAIVDYRRRIGHLGSRMPDTVRHVAEHVCLHDADYLGYTITPVPKSSGETAMVAVQQSENVVLLFYVLAEEPSLSLPYDASVFSEQGVQWLYDELDVVDHGVFSHEALLSNGRVLSIRFVALDVLTIHKRDFDRFSTSSVSVAARS